MSMAMDLQAKYEWSEVEPGCCEREADEAEQYYTILARMNERSGWTAFAITGCVTISVALPSPDDLVEVGVQVEEALRKAWLQLRRDHPTIAAPVRYDPIARVLKKRYNTFASDEERDKWLNDTFRTTKPGYTGAAWANEGIPVDRLPKLYVVTPPCDGDEDTLKRDLIFRSPHDIVDGIGTLHLLNNLIKNAAEALSQERDGTYSEPSFGREMVNLSPPLRIAAAIPPQLSPELQNRLDEMRTSNTAIEEGKERLTIPYNKTATIPSIHKRVVLDRPVPTARLLRVCQEHGVTVTHAYHASIIIAMRDLQNRALYDRKMRYINYCLINERPNCRPPFNSPQHAAAVYHSVSFRQLAVDIDVPKTSLFHEEGGMPSDPKKTYMRVLHEVRDFYISVCSDPSRSAMIPSIWASSTEPYPRLLPPWPTPNAEPSVSISSMGVLERILKPQHGHFNLDNPWVTGDELGTGLGVFLGTWRGELSLSAAYNSAFHEEDGVLDFLRRCQNVLEAGLGLIG